MAGSYEHLINTEEDGEKIVGGWHLIEHMGDAQEAAEEMFWLIQRAIGTKEACRLIDEEFCPMDRGEIPPDSAYLEMMSAFNRPVEDEEEDDG